MSSGTNLSSQLISIRKELSKKKNKVSGPNKGKSMTARGSDFIRQIEVFPPQLLDGNQTTGIKLVAKYDISPSSFPNTRLELMSNTYQLFRFKKVTISYTSTLPTAINGIYIAYIDTDPSEQELVGNSTDLLRIARSHQGSIQGKIRDNWSLSMPERSDDQFFFIGDSGDARFSRMGTLYIYQVGQATKFDGTPLTQELASGVLNIHWTCEFNNPQLAKLDRIYDAISEKNILRVYNNITWYRTLNTLNTITSATHIAGTPYRQATFIVDHDLFQDYGVGDYRIVLMPLKLSLSNTIQRLNTFALPYSIGQYSYGALPNPGEIYQMVSQGLLTAKQVIDFVKEAYKIVKGGIKVAKEVYDVIQVVSSAFVYNQATGVNILADIDDPNDLNINNSHESLPIGSVVVHYDGATNPIIQSLVEYQDVTRAADASTSFTYQVLAICYKLPDKVLGNPNQVTAGEPLVNPSLPFLIKY
jgi:hypothetical protein